MINWFKNLFRKKDAFQAKTLTQLRGEQLKTGAVKGPHLSDDAMLSIKNHIASNDSVGTHFGAYKLGNQSIPANTWTKLEWTEVVEDRASGWDYENNAYTIPYNGIYLIGCSLRWDTQTDGTNNILQIYRNGEPITVLTDITVSQKGSQYFNTVSNGIDFGRLNAGDVLEAWVYTTVDSVIIADRPSCHFDIMQLI